MAAMLTADWILVGRDSYFRKLEVYPLNWTGDVNLDTVMLTAAPNGGPIAIVRDPKKFVQIHGAGKSIIAIFSGSGEDMGSILWNNGILINFGWSEAEQLVCVKEDGGVFLYDLFGNFEHQFSMSSKPVKVIDAKVFTGKKTGVAILTTTLTVHLINNIDDPKNRALSKIVDVSNMPISSLKWCVLTGTTETRNAEVLVASAGSSELFRLNDAENIARSFPKPTSKGNVIDLCLSIDGHHLALFTDTGHLWLGKADLSTQYCEILLDNRTTPKQMLWCGSDGVVCYWPGSVIVVNRVDGDNTMLTYDTPLYLTGERDGVRIFSSNQHELLQKVPPNVQEVLRINSVEPGCYLLEASKHYQKRSHRADEYIALAKDDLSKAVEQCIGAASFEFDADVQKMLMRAAQFGKCFLNDHDPTLFVEMCRDLRVLNAVRDPRIGIAITYKQMHARNYQVLLDRLVARRHYYLAIQVAKFLKIKEEDGASRILVNWACYKVKQRNVEWNVLAREIADKLGYSVGISYDFIAKQATEAGNTALAIKLLDYEPCARKQVPLLLQLNEDKSALEKAIASGDTDLIYDVLLYMSRKNKPDDFCMTIHNYPMALALYTKYCKERSPDTLNSIYNFEDDHKSLAIELIRDSFKRENTSSRDTYFQNASEKFKIAKEDLNASLCDEAHRLFKHQKTLERADTFPQEKFIGKSVHDTLRTLLRINQIKLAEKFKSEYKIPDRRYWWLRIEVLAEQGNWLELRKFSKSKKSPIGYGPFVLVCLKYKRTDEADSYLERVDDKSKFKILVRAEKYEEAVEVAYQQKYLPGLLFLQAKCRNNAVISEKIQVYLAEYDKYEGILKMLP